MDRYRAYTAHDDPPRIEGDNSFTGVNSYDAPENLPPGQCQAAVNMDFSTQDANTRGGWVCLPALGVAPFGANLIWASRTSSSDLSYTSVAYGAGTYVAVADAGGVANCVMTSPDGLTWTTRTAIEGQWFGVTYGAGLFVAVGVSATAGGVMTSPNGVTWTARTASSLHTWKAVVFGGSQFVAVTTSAAAVVMTSPDGLTWTDRVIPLASSWAAVTYGAGRFVAANNAATTTSFLYSDDGVTWTLVTVTDPGVINKTWTGIAYNGRFVAVASGGDIAYSVDAAATWAPATAPEANPWTAIANGSAGLVAIASSGTNRSMISANGVTWTAIAAAAANQWAALCFGNGVYVAVSNTGTGNRAMTAGATSNVYASGLYSDPDDAGSQWMMLVGSGSVGFYAFGRTARTVSISGYTVSEMSTVVQCNNQVYIFRGADATPLYWTGDWSAPFTIAPTTTPAAGFGIIPNSNQATFYQDRLWVIDGKDAVAASDVLDFTAFDEIANDFNLNTGSSDYLVTTFPFGVATLVVFKNKSIIALQYVDGVLNDVAATEITRQVGAIGINSVVSVGPDLVYMSDQNVNLLSLTSTSNALQHKTQPLSRNINSIIRRVNWGAANKVSMAYNDNKLYIALPLDNSPTCNAVVVYNFITEQWFGEWNFAAELGIAIQGWLVANYFGTTRLHAVTEDGRIFVTGEGYNDISGTTLAEITTSLTTRAYVFDNENRISRRFYADLGTNRPDFSVTAYVDGASEHEEITTDQTYSRANSWLFNDSTYTMSNANDDYNRAFRQDYATGPDAVQPGTGILPEMLQEYRYPLITRRKGRLSWFRVDNSQGRIVIQGVGNEAHAGDRGSLVQVG